MRTLRIISIRKDTLVNTGILFAFFCFLALTTNIRAEEAPAPLDGIQSAVKTLMSGKPEIHLRYRWENVDDDLVPANEANASTLRAVLGYQTGVLNGISVYAEMEHVAQLGTDDYREGGFDAAKAGLYPIVADPPGTELNQAYVRYSGYKGLDVKLGRQNLTYRKAPFHRFIGNVLWRQNWQTYDALRVAIKPIDKLKLEYAYVNQVNRIFGDDAPGAAAKFDCDCHLLNAQYKPLKFLNLEAYGYILDIENAALNSTDTFGIRANGAYPLSEKWKFVYAGEFATQSESNRNPRDIDENYYLVEGGLGYTFGASFIKSLLIKFDYEVLEGDGMGAFITPLATGHAYQGWADRFLATPLDGIQDFYITAIAGGVFGGKFLVSYHMLESDNMSYDYGDELNVQYTRKFKKYFTFGSKAAVYSADRNSTALARAAGVQNNDVTKIWVWFQFDY